jgi:hypothetical protein
MLWSVGPASAEDCNVIVCEMAPKPFWHVDNRIRVSTDCSFKNAGDEWGHFLEGNSAVDIGGGRVGQRWISSGCGTYETVVFTDCNSKEVVEVSGVCTANTNNHSGIDLKGKSTSADLLFPPYGNLTLASNSTIPEIQELANKNGYGISTNRLELIGSMKKRNQMDAFCGCKLYYPTRQERSYDRT